MNSGWDGEVTDGRDGGTVSVSVASRYGRRMSSADREDSEVEERGREIFRIPVLEVSDTA